METPQQPAVSAGRAGEARRRDRLGWLGVLGITAVVALSWAPLLNAAYGANHEGQVFGRLALQVRNLHQLGLVGSDYATNWEPYEEGSYAHHPPLATLVSVGFGALPGEGEWQVRLGPYLLGLLVIPAAAWLLRSLGVRWVPTLLTLALVAGTGLYWAYGRIVFDLGPILAVAAAVTRIRSDPDPPRRYVLLACATAFVAGFAGWLCLAFAAGLGLWLLAARRLERVTVAVGLSMVAGLAVTLAFVLGVAGAGEMESATRFRTGGGSMTVADFLARQWEWLTELFPVWSLVLLPLGVAAGLARRTTRGLTAFSTVIALAWILAIPNGSYVHNYWIYALLVPFVVGVGTLLDLAWGRLPAWRVMVAVGLGIALAGGFAQEIRSDFARDHVTGPVAAGTLLKEHGPAPGQRTAWVVAIPAPREVAYYWDLPPQVLRRRTAAEIPDGDLVLLNLDRLPNRWLAASVADSPEARRGPYFLVTGADVRTAMMVPSSCPPGEPCDR